MDNLDAGIIRFFTAPSDFQWDLRASFSDAARRLDVAEGTVRSRFQHLMDDGVVRGWHVMVNPGLLGRRLLRVEVPVPDGAAKQRLQERVRLLEGAHLLFDYLDTGMAVVFYCQDDDEGRLTRLVESLADEPVRAVPVPSQPTPASDDAATWRTIQVLRQHPRAPLPELAKELGVSAKTAARRIAAMQAQHAVFLTVDVDFGKMSGAFVVEVRIGLAEDADRATWRDRILAWPGLIFSNLQGAVLVASRLVSTPRDVTLLRQELEAADGAAWASTDVIQERLVLDDWLDGEVARRARSKA